MSLKLVKRNKVRVPVKGTLADEDGKPVNFKFMLLCTRLDQTEIDEAIKSKDESVKDFVHRVTNGWEDVQDEDGALLPFGTENLKVVLEQPGMAVLCYQTYLKEVSVAAKN